jgi:predicted transposase YdaD
VTVSFCELCAEFDVNFKAAYQELAEEKMKGRREGEAAQRKLSRIPSASHAHQGKQGCSRVQKEDADRSLPTDL